MYLEQTWSGRDAPLGQNPNPKLTVFLTIRTKTQPLRRLNYLTVVLTPNSLQIRGNRKVQNDQAEQVYEALNKYGTDLVAVAESGKIGMFPYFTFSYLLALIPSHSHTENRSHYWSR